MAHSVSPRDPSPRRIRRLKTIALPRIVAGRQLGRCTTLHVANLAQVRPQPIEWLWAGRIAIGKVTLLTGEAGLGKSLAALSVAATVSTGGAWPCREGRAE